MIKDWKAFLSENDTELNSITISSKEMLFDLSDQGLIKVSGEDAESFLQNQLTNDIRNVTETTHQTSAWCNPKGRIIANFQVFMHDESYYLSLSTDLIETVMKKLQMYVMMSKVTIEDVTDSMMHFAYMGDLQKHIEDAPSTSNQTLQHNNLTIIRLNDEQARYEMFTNNIDDAKALWNQCLSSATPTDNNGWNYLNIAAGLPIISEASSESWVPQMVNFIAIGGVDFKKGCYPGQEIVARLNYLGKSKRQMYRLQINTNELPNIGDAISSDSDKEAGKILNAAFNPEGIIEVLAIMKIAQIDSRLSLAGNTNTTITLLELPYPMDDE